MLHFTKRKLWFKRSTILNVVLLWLISVAKKVAMFIFGHFNTILKMELIYGAKDLLLEKNFDYFFQNNPFSLKKNRISSTVLLHPSIVNTALAWTMKDIRFFCQMIAILWQNKEHFNVLNADGGRLNAMTSKHEEDKVSKACG